MKLLLAALTMVGSVCSASPVTDTFYENASAAPLVSLIENAKTSLDIEIYEMDDPQVLTSIEAAVNRGVVVRVVQEGTPVGAACKIFTAKATKDSTGCATQKALVATVQNGGGQYVAFNHAALCGIKGKTCYEHGKILVADGSQALISTGNFNTTNLCDKTTLPLTTSCDRDYSVITTDTTVVGMLETIFAKDLAGVAYSVNSVMTAEASQKMTVSPFSLAPLVAFLGTAKTKIQIQNQYLDDADLNAAIVAAARRGVQVEVQVASECSFGPPKASDTKSWTATFSGFDSAGIKTSIFTRAMQVNGISGYLHAKTIVVDGTSAWVGSVNGSVTSLTNNREYGIFLNDAVSGQELSADMEQDFQDPNSESWQDSLTCKNDPSSYGSVDDVRF